MPQLLQPRERAVDEARGALMQRALVRPAIELADAEGDQRRLDLADHQRHRGAPDLARLARRGLRQAHRELGDVVALVAILGRPLATRERLDRLAERAYLRAGIVDVELALDSLAANSSMRASASP